MKIYILLFHHEDDTDIMNISLNKEDLEKQKSPNNLPWVYTYIETWELGEDNKFKRVEE